MAIWEKLFSKITFKDYPDTSTPINADNLNKMTNAIDGIDDRVVELNSNLEQTNSKFEWKKLNPAGTSPQVNVSLTNVGNINELYIATEWDNLIIPMVIPYCTLTDFEQTFFGGMYNTDGSYISVKLVATKSYVKLDFMNVSGDNKADATLFIFYR